MMTNRERLLAILDGKSPDRIPWIPRMEIWYLAQRLAGTLPAEYQDMRLGEIRRDLGIGNPARTGRVYSTRIRGVDTIVRRDGLRTTTEYITPYGTVSQAGPAVSVSCWRRIGLTAPVALKARVVKCCSGPFAACQPVVPGPALSLWRVCWPLRSVRRRIPLVISRQTIGSKRSFRTGGPALGLPAATRS